MCTSDILWYLHYRSLGGGDGGVVLKRRSLTFKIREWECIMTHSPTLSLRHIYFINTYIIRHTQKNIYMYTYIDRGRTMNYKWIPSAESKFLKKRIWLSLSTVGQASIIVNQLWSTTHFLAAIELTSCRWSGPIGIGRILLSFSALHVHINEKKERGNGIGNAFLL